MLREPSRDRSVQPHWARCCWSASRKPTCRQLGVTGIVWLCMYAESHPSSLPVLPDWKCEALAYALCAADNFTGCLLLQFFCTSKECRQMGMGSKCGLHWQHSRAMALACRRPWLIWHVCCRIERRQQFVTRRVRLPESADMSKITAKIDNGTLVIDVPKNPDKVRQRQIDVT